MVTRNTAWPAGTPCWVDLGTDVAQAAEFYSGLFGWRVDIGGEEVGGYANCFLGDEFVAGLGPLQEGQTSAWTTYLSSTDVDADAAKITAAGGQIVLPPLQVSEFGRMVVAIDTAGAGFGLWEAGKHTGVTLANEPGSLVWNEQMSADLAASKEFYAKVFGYAYEDMEGAPGGYATLNVPGGEQPVGGIGGGLDAGTPAYWGVYFQVADADATLEKVKELGGSVLDGAVDTPFGRMATVADDQGAQFKVMGVPAS
ncbi:VOC family protein [Actinokineospora iranica]|uniref:VOC domain-containing protein n=1 Tax=Actinokineospora iranica TaxID=1271860 RepID=A0A1G6LLZ2_9PSEU|nr:VOC family protein [Actinokineospora iranica]SDC44067.1 hypothetical protein SAMN05216174_102134 [Actinokineospora iranica]